MWLYLKLSISQIDKNTINHQKAQQSFCYICDDAYTMIRMLFF